MPKYRKTPHKKRNEQKKYDGLLILHAEILWTFELLSHGGFECQHWGYFGRFEVLCVGGSCLQRGLVLLWIIVIIMGYWKYSGLLVLRWFVEISVHGKGSLTYDFIFMILMYFYVFLCILFIFWLMGFAQFFSWCFCTRFLQSSFCEFSTEFSILVWHKWISFRVSLECLCLVLLCILWGLRFFLFLGILNGFEMYEMFERQLKWLSMDFGYWLFIL